MPIRLDGALVNRPLGNLGPLHPRITPGRPL